MRLPLLSSVVKYTKEILQEAVDHSISIAGVLRNLGLKQAGGTHAHISKRIKKFGIDTGHFLGQGHNKGGIDPKKLSANEILVMMPEGSLRQKVSKLRRALNELGVQSICVKCGLENVWNGYPIQLEIDHINGNWLDNKIENLRYLCPNCHSQIPNHSNIKGL